MEDAAIHDLDVGDGNSLFAVFDGHGGKISEIRIGAEVSDYVSKVFTKILVNEPAYKKKDYIKALDESFRKMDEAIESP